MYHEPHHNNQQTGRRFSESTPACRRRTRRVEGMQLPGDSGVVERQNSHFTHMEAEVRPVSDGQQVDLMTCPRYSLSHSHSLLLRAARLVRSCINGWNAHMKRDRKTCWYVFQSGLQHATISVINRRACQQQHQQQQQQQQQRSVYVMRPMCSLGSANDNASCPLFFSSNFDKEKKGNE